MKTYLVGGAVRDKLLGIPVKDRDWVVVGATPGEMLARGFQQVGKDFPVFLHPETREEYALARTERKSGKGYTGFVVHADKDVSLEDDLMRRDLTINAMAEDAQGQVIDPFKGRRDIDAKVLRHVSPAFVEDPLRVLRVARFAARYHHLGFSIAGDTMDLMQAISTSGELKALVSERVWTETAIALAEKSPQVYFRVLRECGGLKDLLPEIDNLFGIAQPKKYHPEIDTGIHTFMVVEQAAALTTDPVVRFAALMHDVGKGAIPEIQRPNFRGHEELGVDLINRACKRIKAPNEFRDLAKMVCLHHTRCHQARNHGPAELLDTLEKTDAFRKPERFEKFLLACEADARGRLGLEDNPYPQSAILRQALTACRSVNAGEFVAQGFRDADIGKQIHRSRLQRINEWMNSP